MASYSVRRPHNPDENRETYAMKTRREKAMYCPACHQGFHGQGADERYKAHWREKHSKLKE